MRRRLLSLLCLIPLALGSFAQATPAARAATDMVTLAGSLQTELGCATDWQADCAATHLTFDATDQVWQATFDLPAGEWNYKVAINDSWDENYGAGGAPGGGDIALSLGSPTRVTFLFSPVTHWVADSVTSTVATVAGSMQDELGCPGDWQPDCLRTWMQDPDGNGTYTFATTGLPAGDYEFKVALNQNWDVSYGPDGGSGNIAFSVAAGQRVTFRFNAATHLPSVTVESTGPALDNNVSWDGVRHDSRDTLYRSPSGAVPAGTPVTLRLRTFHNDVTAVKLRLYSLNAGGQTLHSMTRVASNVACYDPALADSRCDYWAYTIPASHAADNLWYRFVVTDGTDTDYYNDNTAALDGGSGSMTDDAVDQSWALMLHVPGFAAPAWAKDATVYQIFPDRFRNGRANNDPVTGDTRYADPVLKLDWGVKPEGYCRNYESQACPWRFDDTPPADSPTKEQPRGRDYYGGDLKGVDQQLPYLKSLGINTIYFNPIFDAGSNHSYDTQDYTKIDPYFGSSKDFDNLVKHAKAVGVRIILDGVFNHLSSDSPFFDRYGHYGTVGACESVSSPWRDWFVFKPQADGPCAGPDGPHTMGYEAWFGFDSIPVLVKTEAEVQQYFLTAPDAIAKLWLRRGAAGWRLDVSGDASFPDGYWEKFREVTKAVKADSLSISETWQKDSTLLRSIRGDRLDTTMNYRLRDAVLGLLTPQAFDAKGFADSGRRLKPSEFAARLASVREDYPDAAYYSLLNLLDSHDTERALWTLTEGTANTAGRENPTALATGKQRLRLASLIQFTQAGMPSVYYGDEVGVTGADDPDDRRTYPWADLGGQPDTELFAHYQRLAQVRSADPALRQGDFRVLLADDGAGTVAYGRATGTAAGLVLLNPSDERRELRVPVAGYLADGTELTVRIGVGVHLGTTVRVADGAITLALPALGGAYLASGTLDLTGPGAPSLSVTSEASGSVELSWSAVAGATSYQVFVSPVSGGGWVAATPEPVTGTSTTVTGLVNARKYFFIVRAIDAAGNLGEASNEVTAVPHPTIGWANLQWPPTMTHTLSAVDRTDTAYGQVWIDGLTSQPGATAGLLAELGYGPVGTDPRGDAWTWVTAAFNTQVGNNDEYAASVLPEAAGSYDYVYRYSVTEGRDWLYADLAGPVSGTLPANPGRLTVTPSSDTTAPAVPSGLTVTGASPAAVELAWTAVDDPTLHAYEVGRRLPGGSFAVIGSSSTPFFTDTTVTEGATYEYAVRSVDTSFNRSDWSTPVTATAAARTVTVQINLTVPASTDATGRQVYIAGFLDRLDGGLPQWNPGGVQLTRVDATHHTITLTGREGTQIEYKYALGSWDYVEKDGACGEVANRPLTLTYGTTGTQVVNDVVLNWRNVTPCGN